MKLNSAHWTVRGYKQRMTIAQWRRMLLDGRDSIIIAGRVETLVATKLGAGVVEVGLAADVVERRRIR